MTLEQAYWGGNVNSTFPLFSPGEGGEHRYLRLVSSDVVLVRCCRYMEFRLHLSSLSLVSAAYFFPSTFLYFHMFGKTTACLVYEYHWLMSYHLLPFLLYAVFKLL